MLNRPIKDRENLSESYSRKLISGKVTATEGVRGFDNMRYSYGAINADRYDTLRALQKENKFRLAWYIIFLTLGLVCLIIEPKGWFNFLDLVVVMINVDLVARGKVIGIYIGVFECLMYCYICFTSGVYGEVIKMALINIPLNIVAIVSWTKNMRAQKRDKYNTNQKETGVVIRKLPKKAYIWIPFVMIALYVGFFFGLRALKSNALIFSTAVLVFTVFSKILSGMRYKESYIFSLCSASIQVVMWIEVIIRASSSGSGIVLSDLTLIVMAIAMVVNDIEGYQMWKSMYRKVAINGAELFAMRKINVKRIIKLRRQYQKLYWNKKVDMEKNS